MLFFVVKTQVHYWSMFGKTRSCRGSVILSRKHAVVLSEQSSMTMIIFMNARPGVVEEVVIAMITRATAERAVIGIVIDAVDEMMTMMITTDQILAQETQIWPRSILVERPRIVFERWCG
jgi:hypothetical protein